jgi:hypothetical protein
MPSYNVMIAIDTIRSSYNITYDINGGTGGPGNETATGSSYTVSTT